MKVTVAAGDIVLHPADAIVVGLFEGDTAPAGPISGADAALKGAISDLLKQGEIKGKQGEVALLHTLGKLPASRVAIVGLGKPGELTADRVRRASAEACRAMRRAGVKKAGTAILGAGRIEPAMAVQAITEGCLLGLYDFSKYCSSKDPGAKMDELVILTIEGGLAALQHACHRGTIIAEATNMARNMINEPSNHMTPAEMAEIAKDLAHAHGLELTLLERDQMRRVGMGALLAVAQGSQQPPKFTVLRYKGDPSSTSALGLVGKGITFDSGGISLKPAEGMDEMKDDMSGGAIVFAAISAIARLKLKLNVAAICGATENMPGGSALKPGDIIRAMNGKSIEIVSTDAEGRLTLADALCYAVKHRLSPLVDVATLTGACRVALGQVATGVFSNNQEFAAKVLEAASRAGERMWQMPMFEEYKEGNKSDIADIKNSGGRYGGAITAAQFLSEFVAETPWVHLDIAGTSFTDKVSGYKVKGATGVAVRTLVELAQAMAK